MNRYLNAKQLRVKDCKVIAIGDSHIMTGINPGFSNTIKNYAQSSEPYVASYLKIKKLLSGNPDIGTVLLGFGYHNLSSYYDDKLMTNEATAIFNNNIQLLGRGTLDQLHYDHKRFVNSFIVNQCIYPQINKLYLGDFKNTDSSQDKSNVDQTIAKHFYDGNTIRNFSDSFNLVYLDNIVDLCLEFDVQLVLVRTPTSNAYSRKVPNPFKNKYLSIVRYMNKRGINTFASNKEASQYYFKDHSHLSSKGAGVFTPLLLNYIESIK